MHSTVSPGRTPAYEQYYVWVWHTMIDYKLRSFAAAATHQPVLSAHHPAAVLLTSAANQNTLQAAPRGGLAGQAQQWLQMSTTCPS
jgi:hypothetical protein